ncbi:small acid-soluble spore protein P [Paenibacillus sp. J2TS4]|nr:small acid-soluble spore protein P [Paenibacillus sp. J2TS4]GIP35489.1 hypothetical protein J2TS4_46990 [Paenibacillus sp. J2TS4]
MAKEKAIPVPSPNENQGRQKDDKTFNEPLSGSKKVKNRNHSRHNHGEGS